MRSFPADFSKDLPDDLPDVEALTAAASAVELKIRLGKKLTPQDRLTFRRAMRAGLANPTVQLPGNDHE